MALYPGMSPTPTAWMLGFLAERNWQVLEWGAGNSTCVFPRCMGPLSEWLAIETDYRWSDRVARMAPRNVRVVTVADDEQYLSRPGETAPYDCIIVDGKFRPECLQAAKRLLKGGGTILLHDGQRPEYREATNRMTVREIIRGDVPVEMGAESDELWVLTP